MQFKVLTDVTRSILAATGLLILTCQPLRAELLPADSSAATIYTYFSISDSAGAPNLEPEKFQNQINEFISGKYNVISLGKLLDAQQSGQSLPPQTIALTFDLPDKTFMANALPLLVEHELPFTVFISPGTLDRAQDGDLNWDDIATLADNKLATLGLTDYDPAHLGTATRENLTTDLNRAKTKFREKLGFEPDYYAYPFGIMSPVHQDVVARHGFKAAFGQHSGVPYKGANLLYLPRFTMTNEFSDIERLRMTSQALPFPVSDVEPASMILETNPPFLGFTVDKSIPADELKRLTCFASGIGELNLQILGKNRVEIRFPKGFDDERGRVNCTLPVHMGEDGAEIRWRWLGFLYSIPQNRIVMPQENTDANAPTDSATDFASPEQP